MKSSTETLIAAMRILARDIRSTDGVANAAIREAAERMEELQNVLKEIAQHTDPEDSDSYRADDREGCLDTIHHLASTAMSKGNRKDEP
jgi:hypothetical protein